MNFPASYGPQDLATLYDAPASAIGSGQQVSVIAEGDLTQPRADLATFEDQFGLPHVTWNQIQVGAPSTDTAGVRRVGPRHPVLDRHGAGRHADQRL